MNVHATMTPLSMYKMCINCVVMLSSVSIFVAQVCCGQMTGDIPLPEEQRIYRDMNPSNPEMKLLYVTPEKVYA